MEGKQESRLCAMSRKDIMFLYRSEKNGTTIKRMNEAS